MHPSITGSQLLAGKESKSGTGRFRAVNPRTREPLPRSFSEATPAEIDQAAQAAAAAYEELGAYPASRLAAFLEGVAAQIEGLGDYLLQVADEETGLGLPRLRGERARTTGQLRKFAALLREGSYVQAIIDTAQPEREPVPMPSIRRMLFPLGPVAVFSASNFPFAFAVAGGDTASAFAAGCPVVVKGHPSHPATSELFGHAINQAVAAHGFPPGTFSLIQGETVAVGQELVRHPHIAAVAFTGSLRAGRAIYDAAAARPVPIPVYAEMGSTNPIVILPQALATRSSEIAAGLVGSLTLGSGQFCTNPGLVFLLESADTEAFIAEVAGRMAAQEPGVLLNERIESGLAATVAGTVGREGVERLVGGEAVADGPYCFANTVLRTTAATFAAEPALQVEHFGPVTLFVVAPSFAALQEAVGALHGNLTAAVHATDAEQELAGALFHQLREKVGRLLWNGFPTGVEVVHAMQHGGPYPATTAPATTSVGMTAIKRFLRPVAYQNVPDPLLPPALQDDNPLGIWRIVDGQYTTASLPAV